MHMGNEKALFCLIMIYIVFCHLSVLFFLSNDATVSEFIDTFGEK